MPIPPMPTKWIFLILPLRYIANRQYPNPKLQIPNNIQYPNLNYQKAWSLVIGIYLDIGAWYLEFHLGLERYHSLVINDLPQSNCSSGLQSLRLPLASPAAESPLPSLHAP